MRKIVPSVFHVGPWSISYTTRDQRDLEKFSIQFAYGQREILLDYMGLDRSHLFLGIIQHGVLQEGISPLLPVRKEHNMPRNSLLNRSPLWVYSQDSADFLTGMGLKNVTAIGAPWNYLKQLPNFPTTSLNFQLQETYCVFPRHFHTSINIPISRAQIRKKIAYWREIVHGRPITICLYSSEFMDPIWQEVCQEEGIQTLCAGNGMLEPIWAPHRSRLEYLLNLARILSGYSHFIFESMTSGFFYAASMQRTVGYFPGTIFQEEEELVFSENTIIDRVFPEAINEFVDPAILSDRVNSYLGLNSMRSSDELRQILIYKQGVVA